MACIKYTNTVYIKCILSVLTAIFNFSKRSLLQEKMLSPHRDMAEVLAKHVV